MANSYYTEGILNQKEFIDKYFSFSSASYWNLIGGPGFGKTTIIRQIIQREIKNSNIKRVLMLSPYKVLINQNVQTYQENTEFESIVITKNKFFEMETNQKDGENIFPNGSIVMMTFQSAINDYIAPSILSTNWDLLVIDDFNMHVRGKNNNIRKLIKKLLGCGKVKKAIIGSLTPVKYYGLKKFKLGSYETAIKRIEFDYKKGSNRIKYQLNSDEKIIYNSLREIIGDLKMFGDSFGKIQSNLIKGVSNSSLHTTEILLRSLFNNWRPIRNKLAHGRTHFTKDIQLCINQIIQNQLFQTDYETGSKEGGFYDEITKDWISEMNIEPGLLLKVHSKFEKLFDRISDLEIDSKLECFLSYIKKIHSKNKYVYIFTKYTSSANYLSMSIPDEIGSVYQYNSSSQMKNNMESFEKDGGIVVVTTPSMHGIQFKNFGECISYESIQYPYQFLFIISRFRNAFDLSKAFNITTFQNDFLDEIFG